MHEQTVSGILKKEAIEYIISLPCDRTKNLCEILEKEFRYITISREEDGIGILSGLSLMGKRGVLQMQSSGLGNSLNALMTLPYLYRLPLPILASWRGYYQEKIPAQIPFNEKIPDLLKLYNIPCTIIQDLRILISSPRSSVMPGSKADLMLLLSHLRSGRVRKNS
jgi:sulfopyruvate decarboxylase, alpha subunit